MSEKSGWVKLGDYTLKKGALQYVELTNSTGESADTDRRVLFDAIKIVPKTDASEPSSDTEDAHDPNVSLVEPTCSGIPSGHTKGNAAMMLVMGIVGCALGLRRRKKERM